MPKISDEILKKYFSSGGAYYPLHNDAVKLYDALRIHADGEFPKDMITRRRPSETDEILAYREQTYKPITKLPISKVINSLSKIRRSPDWAIDYPADSVPGKIIEEETLEQYCTVNLPGYTSITNWIFGLLLKQNAIDANAVVAVIPKEILLQDQYSKPVPIVFNSDQIMAYDEHYKFCILKSKVTVTYNVDDNNTKTGQRFYYIDDQELIIYDEGKDGFNVVFQQPIPFGEMPVWKLHAEAYKQYDNMSLNKSRIETMSTFLDEAACEYSDLKGSKIQHLFPLMWYYQNRDCATCKGAGTIPSTTGPPTTCLTCGGGGKMKFSPFAQIQVEGAKLGEQSNPVPPAGYIVRDTVILELQEKSVDKNIYKSLSAINMQFLDQTPLSISGDAKQVDREELNNFVYNFAEDIVYSADKSIYFINEWRYSYIVSDKAERQAMLPQIPVPQNFDLLPEDYLMKEVSDARNAKVNPLLIAILEQQLAAKKFYNEPDLSSTIGLYFDLDPLPGISIDDKMSLKSNNAITEEDFVISTYMAQFIKRALKDDKDFAAKAYDKQMEVLKKYAAEKISANDTGSQMIDAAKQKVLDEIKAANANAPNPTDAGNIDTTGNSGNSATV